MTAKTERQIQTDIMLTHGRGDVRMWRNNVGTGWCGKLASRTPEAVTLRAARPVNFGLCEGSADLIGLRSVTITPDMVGQTVAVFVALEVKTPTGRPTPEQQRFLTHVSQAGGIAGIARSPEEAGKILFE